MLHLEMPWLRSKLLALVVGGDTNIASGMDQAMNPYAQGMGYLGQYGGIASPYQTNTGYTQSPYLGAMQGGMGGAQLGYGIGNQF
jgi:hypothetical protein